MIYYYHMYKVSSGKEYKWIEKIYKTPEEAEENLLLMGGFIKELREIN